MDMAQFSLDLMQRARPTRSTSMSPLTASFIIVDSFALPNGRSAARGIDTPIKTSDRSGTCWREGTAA
jgi:hypothetical protein